MANELKVNARDAIHDPTAFRIGRIGRLPTALVLHSNSVDFEDVSSGDNEVRDGANPAARGPIGVEIVGMREGDLGGEVGAEVSEEGGGAVFNAGGAVHHLVGGVAHRGWLKIAEMGLGLGFKQSPFVLGGMGWDEMRAL